MADLKPDERALFERKNLALPPSLYAKAPTPPRKDPRHANPANYWQTQWWREQRWK